eukprot:6210191-Pleurochrysis_carterae.AAC.2
MGREVTGGHDLGRATRANGEERGRKRRAGDAGHAHSRCHAMKQRIIILNDTLDKYEACYRDNYTSGPCYTKWQLVAIFRAFLGATNKLQIEL